MNHEPNRSLLRPLLALAGAGLLGVLVLVFMGTQVSGVLSTVGASVGGGPYVGSNGGGDEAGGEGHSADEDGGDGASDGDGEEPSGDGGWVANAAPLVEPLVIKTGSLELQVEAINTSVTSATQVIAGLGGYASGSDRSGTGPDAIATITFRMPSGRWDEALEALRGLAVEVLGEHSTTEDVSAQVVDLDARIRNLQATERALQAIMDRADVIKDVLSVQSQLTTVRSEIEQLVAEKGHLEEQAAYSTVKVTFTLKPAPVLAVQRADFDPASEIDAASAKLVRILQRVTTAGIWFVIVWLPVLAALAVFGLVAFFVARWVRRALGPRELEEATG
jgi:Domain of unknown function (DUF4349)